jgi:hypothetical protein
MGDDTMIQTLRWGEELRRQDIPDDVESFLRVLGGPTVLTIPGRDPSRTRALVALLHGDEPSSVLALHRWLLRDQQPAVNVLVVIAAIDAALTPPGFALRFLPGGRDLNRCWFPPFNGPEGAMAKEILEILRAAQPECLLDLHNNSGHTPPYGISPRIGSAEQNLVALFAKRMVHTPLELGTLLEATQSDFPGASIECGRSGDPVADEVAFEGLERYLRCEDLALEAEPKAMKLFVDPVRVCIREGVEIAFGEGPDQAIDLTVSRSIDRFNFEILPTGTRIGWLGARGVWPIEVRSRDGRKRGGDLFAVNGGVLETLLPLIPVMMTSNPRSALEDCLFYALRLAEPLPGSEAS